MSNRSQFGNGYSSTLHSFFLTAKENGYTEFELQLVANQEGRVEFCISPQGHAEMKAKFEIRGNMVRAVANDVSAVPDTRDLPVDYGGTRSGPQPI